MKHNRIMYEYIGGPADGDATDFDGNPPADGDQMLYGLMVTGEGASCHKYKVFGNTLVYLGEDK